MVAHIRCGSAFPFIFSVQESDDDVDIAADASGVSELRLTQPEKGICWNCSRRGDNQCHFCGFWLCPDHTLRDSSGTITACQSLHLPPSHGASS